MFMGIFVLALLLLSMLAAFGLGADSRDPNFSVGRMLDSRPPERV
jgi:hypothetical protein